MSTSPHDLLKLAENLRQQEANESALRCAVSRAYYAALHQVQRVFEQRSQNARINGESSHAEIIGRATAYGNTLSPGRENARTIATYLTRMRHVRNQADYDLDGNFLILECDRVIERSRSVLSLCNEVIEKRQKAQSK